MIPSLAHGRLADDLDRVRSPKPREYPPADNPETLWHALFDRGEGDGVDSLARLTRMSAPWTLHEQILHEEEA